ncbi:LysE/ArgO family amino acid transporter [Roseicyclus mahoneyensis]|uniref:L-lysine exporter family protein LysE/ArgO n=1 Tax=Roseicyclus mahoneyensis TaxID=164332 RepID=A0A316GLC6_9RHOB|nr:LysE/ArgO family amino acid transporter [Roseicyclus mahoneyensis]PWK60998.1 L-lysine exporter family protein LysE/ArgO [Roseicyclus mahoneyensis]
MTAALIAGFALSLSLILAIGAQNAFVLRQGLRRAHVGAVVAVCCLSEAVLIFTGVAGFGAIAARAPWAIEAMRWGGAAFLVVYGLRSLRAALTTTGALEAVGPARQGLRTAIATTLLLTWANPHVYLDTVGLIGAVAATYGEGRWAFGAGALSASVLFFVALGYGARGLAPVFARPAAWRALDAMVGATMLALAVKLALGA